jgi:hypothetical protein
MLDRFGDRAIEIATVVIVVATVLVMLCYAVIAINPNVPFNPFPPPTATTEVVQEVPTWAPTWTPTNTPEPSDTPTPTATWTPTLTPSPTNTPTATPTETPLPPTDTPLPTPTNTRRPPAPTRRPPTATPMPYRGTYMGIRPNCDWSGIHGIVWSAYDLPLKGIQIKVWNVDNGWSVVSSATNDDGIYQIIVPRDKIEGMWYVQVLENGVPASPAWGQPLGGGCVNGAHEMKVDWQRRF